MKLSKNLWISTYN